MVKVLTKKEVKLRIFDTYLAVIENSCGTKMFKNLYADINGVRTDITNEGDLSCAYFVSTVLLMFDSIERIHATVRSTVVDMENSGWVVTDEPIVGDVIVWNEKECRDGSRHSHIGFFVGQNKAISNNKDLGCPTKHSLEMDGRGIEMYLTNHVLRAK